MTPADDFVQLVERASDLILIVQAGRIRYANPAFCVALGWSREELVGRVASELAHPDERTETQARIARGESGGRNPFTVRRLVRRDGSVLQIESSTFSTVFEGQPAAVLIGRDLTDRQRVRRAEHEFAAMFEALPGIVAVFDRNGVFRYANAAAAASLRCDSPADLIGTFTNDYLLPDDPNTRLVMQRRFDAREILPPAELTLVARDGSRRRAVLGTCSVTFAGAPARLAVGYDVTVERENEQRLAAVFSSSPVGVVALDHALRAQTWNEAAQALFDWRSGAEAPGVFRAMAAQALAAGRSEQQMQLTHNGTPMTVRAIAAPLRLAPTEPISGFVFVLRDVTADEAARTQLRDTSETLQAVFDASPEAITSLEADGRVRSWSGGAERIFGVAAADALGKPAPFLTAEVQDALRRALAGEAVSIDTALGELHLSISLGRLGDARPGCVAVVADVTSRRRLEESLRRSEAMSAMGSLVAGVAHEVRNPLFGMSATLDAMQSRLGNTPGSEPFVAALRHELTRLNELMRDLLEFGKPATTQLVREPLRTVVEAAVRACEGAAAQRGVSIENRLAEPGEVWMDSSRLTQVFQNLIANAVQHAPPASVVRIEALPPEKDVVEVRVVDQGPGFAAADLPRIFEPFFTRRRGGIGLGLSIVQRIAEEHGATVVASNRPEGGAQVAVRLRR